MHWLRQTPPLRGIVGLIGLVIVIESGLLVVGYRSARTASFVQARTEREWRRLVALKPAPTVAQAEMIEADLARAKATLSRLLADLGSRESADAPRATESGLPPSRTDAYIGLTGFVRQMRAAAAQAGVSVPADEQFGFSAYAHVGPEPALIAPLRRQREIIGCVLKDLFASGPRQFAGIQRSELPSGKTDGDSTMQSSHEETSVKSDAFTVDPRISLRQQGVVETCAYRVTFVGYTKALREFLNRVARENALLAVRNVEVQPFKDNLHHRRATPHGADPLNLLVRPAWSQFTVTLEHCEIVLPWGKARDASLTPSTPASVPASPDRWIDPSAQKRGPQWVYDLFTPPALYYDAQTGTLGASPVSDAGRADAAETLLDLELLEVRRGPFRLQLVGYAGGESQLRGVFVEPDTGRTVIGRGGKPLPEYGIEVTRIHLSRPVAGRVGETADAVATALVKDESTGEVIVMTAGERCLAGAPVGAFTSRKNPAFHRELKEGESVALHGVNYCIERLELRPPHAVIVCLAAGSTEPLRYTLTPRGRDAAILAPPTVGSDKSASHSQSTP